MITGTRAEYGLLRPLMEEIQRDEEMQLQIIATGSHLSPEFGLTYREIEKDGFHIDRKIEMLLASDTATGVSKAMGLAQISFAEALGHLQPECVVLLGDRFEILAAACTAAVLALPIAHIHGGEITEGAMDDSFRHAITKLSHFHFVSTDAYRRRVVQMGETPERVYCTGAPGLDNLSRLDLLKEGELEELIGLRLGAGSLLVTYHPVTLERGSAEIQMRELLTALEALPDVRIVFTKPNADMEGRVISDAIDDFVRRNAGRAAAFTSLGSQRYLSVMKYVGAVVGNSSSGIIEAPSVGTPTVDIGNRQSGRVRGESVVHCDPDASSIQAAIARCFEAGFREKARAQKNPYGGPGASLSIKNILKAESADVRKKFFDIPAEPIV